MELILTPDLEAVVRPRLDHAESCIPLSGHRNWFRNRHITQWDAFTRFGIEGLRKEATLLPLGKLTELECCVPGVPGVPAAVHPSLLHLPRLSLSPAAAGWDQDMPLQTPAQALRAVQRCPLLTFSSSLRYSRMILIMSMKRWLPCSPHKSPNTCSRRTTLPYGNAWCYCHSQCSYGGIKSSCAFVRDHLSFLFWSGLVEWG